MGFHAKLLYADGAKEQVKYRMRGWKMTDTRTGNMQI